MNEVNCLKLPKFALPQRNFYTFAQTGFQPDNQEIPLGKDSLDMAPYDWNGWLTRMPPLDDPTKDLTIDNQPVRGLPVFLHFEQLLLEDSYMYRRDDGYGVIPDLGNNPRDNKIWRLFNTTRQPTNYFGKPGTLLRLPKTVVVPASSSSIAGEDTRENAFLIFIRVAAVLGEAFDRENIFLTVEPFNQSPEGNFHGINQINSLLRAFPWCGYALRKFPVQSGSGPVTFQCLQQLVDPAKFIGGDILFMHTIQFNTPNYIAFVDPRGNDPDPNPDVSAVAMVNDQLDFTVTQLNNGIPAYRRYKQIMFPVILTSGTPSPGTALRHYYDGLRLIPGKLPQEAQVRFDDQFATITKYNNSTRQQWFDFTDAVIIPEIRQFFNL